MIKQEKEEQEMVIKGKRIEQKDDVGEENILVVQL